MRRGNPESKKKIASVQVLTHYDPTWPLKLAVDASPYGVGAVISHSMPNGTKRSIAFASCRPDWKRGISHCSWGQEFSPVLVRKEIYITNWPPTADYYFQPQERYTIPGSSTITKDGLFYYLPITTTSAINLQENIANADGLSRLPLSSKETLQSKEGILAHIQNGPIPGPASDVQRNQNSYQTWLYSE